MNKVLERPVHDSGRLIIIYWKVRRKQDPMQVRHRRYRSDILRTF